MKHGIDHPKIKEILTYSEEDADWASDLQKFKQGDLGITRHSAGESSIKALQRMLIFLGYSTTTRGAFSVDGDFGRGTNRGLAHFQFDFGLNPEIKRETLLYPCNWRDAHYKIDNIPDAKLDLKTLDMMVSSANEAMNGAAIMCGDFDMALHHLNAVHSRRLMNCREIFNSYADYAVNACETVQQESGVNIHPVWVLAIIKQETSGVVRPRFEQHYLTRIGCKNPEMTLSEARFLSMSQGLGQIMGSNYKRVGAKSAHAMFTSPIDEQVLFVARFLSHRSFRESVKSSTPEAADFHKVAKSYNGPGYARHHYHESLAGWFREFSQML